MALRSGVRRQLGAVAAVTAAGTLLMLVKAFQPTAAAAATPEPTVTSAVAVAGSALGAAATVGTAGTATTPATTAATTPAAGAGAGVTDQSADRSRTFQTWKDDLGRMFEVAFATTTPGEKRLVEATVAISSPATSSDDLLVERHAVYCAPEGDQTQAGNGVLGVRNVLRGGSVKQTPSYIYTAATPGNQHCWVWISTGRPRASGHDATSNTLKVGAGSGLSVSGPIHADSQQAYAPQVKSPVLDGVQHANVATMTWTAPAGTSALRVSGNTYLTGCTSVNGSYDPVTKLKACQGLVEFGTVTAKTQLVVTQLNAAGTAACATTTFASTVGKQVVWTKDVHHVVVYHGGTVKVSDACGRTFQVRIKVQHVDGPPMVVHRSGSLSAVIPTLALG